MSRADIGFAAIGVAGVIAWALIGFGHALGRPDYDPNELAKDGPFRASRKWLHAQKVMTACTVYAIALAILLAADMSLRSFRIAAFVGAVGPLLFSKVRELVAPTDPDRHTLGEMALDAVTDGCLYGFVWILHALILRDWRLAVVDAIIFAALYRLCRNGARP